MLLPRLTSISLIDQVRLREYMLVDGGNTAPYTGVRAMRRSDDPHRLSIPAQRARLDLFVYDRQKDIGGVAEQPAKDDQLRVQRIEQGGNADAQPAPQLLERFQGHGIASLRGLHDQGDGQLVQVAVRPGGEQG